MKYIIIPFFFFLRVKSRVLVSCCVLLRLFLVACEFSEHSSGVFTIASWRKLGHETEANERNFRLTASNASIRPTNQRADP